MPLFTDLDLGTRLMYVNFAPVNMLDQISPNDQRRPSLFLGATHGLYPHLYILNPLSDSLQGRNLKQYIVPSGAIVKTKLRVETKEELMDHSWHGTARYHLPLIFRGNALVDDYAVRENDMISYLCRFSEEPWTFPVGGGTRSYITTKLSLMKHYIPTLQKQVVLPGRRK